MSIMAYRHLLSLSLPPPSSPLSPLTLSYRINIWTRSAPDVKLPLEDELMARTRLIGKHFKTSVLGFESEQKLSVGGASGLQTEVVFESHKLSEVKGNKDKIIV